MNGIRLFENVENGHNSGIGDALSPFDGPLPPFGLESGQFREAAHQLVDVIIDYYKSLENGGRNVLPDVKPGFMKERVDTEAPLEGEKWQDVFKDIERVVFEGAMHWQSAGNVGYFPTAFSYPALLGDMLCGSVSTIGFTWFSGPSCTELETVMMDWLAKALDLPKCFIHDGKGPGGGVIEGTASEATLITLLSARTKVIGQELSRDPNQTDHEITGRMVAYASKCSHSSVERAGKVAMIKMKLLDFDEDASLRGATLRKAINEDRKNGKIPVYVCATLGTTSCCTYDHLDELGDVCHDENIWLHVDAAYAGSSLLCPEMRYIAKGLEKATSFNFNPHKWMMVNFDCSALWVRDSQEISNSLKMNPVYLRHEQQNKTIDYMHWQLPLGRRFRAIKLWFTLRMIGIEGLRKHIRAGVEKAKHFEKLVRSDQRFEVLFPVTLGLVCFRMVVPESCNQELNELNRKLHHKFQADRKFLITPSEVNGIFFLRVSTGVSLCNLETLNHAWSSLKEKAAEVLVENKE